METIRDGIVFSNDINRILNGKNALDFNYNNIGIPDHSAIESVRFDFKENVCRIFNGKVRIISELEMISSMLEAMSDVYGKYPIITLDKIYVTVDEQNVMFLDCTRLDGSKELVSRNNVNHSRDVDNQIDGISRVLKEEGQRKIILADDVVFSGTVLRTVTKKFLENGIAVMGIRSAISTIESYDFFNSALPLGLKCGYVMGKDVIDQICERDFYFGIAQSGISIKAQNGVVYKAPYFTPFGNPVERASIPREQEIYFSDGCIKRSIALWKSLNRTVYVKELPEIIMNAPLEEPVVKVLERGMIRK